MDPNICRIASWPDYTVTTTIPTHEKIPLLSNALYFVDRLCKSIRNAVSAPYVIWNLEITFTAAYLGWDCNVVTGCPRYFCLILCGWFPKSHTNFWNDLCSVMFPCYDRHYVLLSACITGVVYHSLVEDDRAYWRSKNHKRYCTQRKLFTSRWNSNVK